MLGGTDSRRAELWSHDRTLASRANPREYRGLRMHLVLLSDREQRRKRSFAISTPPISFSGPRTSPNKSQSLSLNLVWQCVAAALFWALCGANLASLRWHFSKDKVDFLETHAALWNFHIHGPSLRVPSDATKWWIAFFHLSISLKSTKKKICTKFHLRI